MSFQIPTDIAVCPHKLNRLRNALFTSNSLLLLTGAGMSTESGIPAYRGIGTVKVHRPMLHSEFLKSALNRQRYWARSAIGYPRLSRARFNIGHLAISNFSLRVGIPVITQNVDGLHHQALLSLVSSKPRDDMDPFDVYHTLSGLSESPVELHGSIHRVICLGCGDVSSRMQLQDRLVQLNRSWVSMVTDLLENKEFVKYFDHGEDVSSSVSSETKPDGDINLFDVSYENFTVPSCKRCHGVLKPDVVFFGDVVDVKTKNFALSVADIASFALVAGTTLSSWSAFSLIKKVHSKGTSTDSNESVIGLVNIGDSRADSLNRIIKIDGRCGTILPRLLKE